MPKLLDELLEAQNSYFEKLRDTGEDALKEAFKEIFDKHPSIYSISWKQYTPYFNDGDPCYFRVGEWDVEWAEEDEDEESEEDDSVDDESEDDESDDEEATDDQAKALEDIENLFASLDDDILESVLGDHITVEVTAEGISVDEYDHD